MILTAFMCSCVSMTDREMTTQERAEAKVIGTVTDKVSTFQPLHIPNKKHVKAKAYRDLMRIARRKYQGNFEIRNITITGGKLSGAQAAFIAGGGGFGILYTVAGLIFNDPVFTNLGIAVGVGTNLLGNIQKFNVTGDVVAIGDVVLIDSVPSGNTGNPPATSGNTDNAPAPSGSNTSSPDRNTGNAPAPGANF